MKSIHVAPVIGEVDGDHTIFLMHSTRTLNAELCVITPKQVPARSRSFSLNDFRLTLPDSSVTRLGSWDAYFEGAVCAHTGSFRRGIDRVQLGNSRLSVKRTATLQIITCCTRGTGIHCRT